MESNVGMVPIAYSSAIFLIVTAFAIHAQASVALKIDIDGGKPSISTSKEAVSCVISTIPEVAFQNVNGTNGTTTATTSGAAAVVSTPRVSFDEWCGPSGPCAARCPVPPMYEMKCCEQNDGRLICTCNGDVVLTGHVDDDGCAPPARCGGASQSKIATFGFGIALLLILLQA